MGKLLQYQLSTKPNEDPLQSLAAPVEVYHKNLNFNWFPRMKSVNFVYNDSDAGTDSVHLLLLSKTFNISEKLDTNKFILCSQNITSHRFILNFPQNTHAKNFFAFIKNDLNKEIPCPIEPWVTYKFLKIVNSR